MAGVTTSSTMSAGSSSWLTSVSAGSRRTALPRYQDVARAVGHSLMRDAEAAAALAWQRQASSSSSATARGGTAPRAATGRSSSHSAASALPGGRAAPTGGKKPSGGVGGAAQQDRDERAQETAATDVIDHFPAPREVHRSSTTPSPSRGAPRQLPRGTSCSLPEASLGAAAPRDSVRSSGGVRGSVRTASSLPVLPRDALGEEGTSAPGRGSSAGEVSFGSVGPTLAEYLRAEEAPPGVGFDLQVRRTLSRPAALAQSATALPYDERELAEVCEGIRGRLRQRLVRAAGGATAAFKSLDLSGSGHVTVGEFADGVTRLGVPWQEITGLRTARDLFKFFDFKHDGYLDFGELFPEEAKRGGTPERVSTPEFWNKWCRNTQEPESMKRGPMWQPGDFDSRIEALFQARAHSDRGADKRKWMSATITRLKNHGKSVSRCREIVAYHLPRGTGPKDQQEVPAFSAKEVQTCKKVYKDWENNHTRTIQKAVVELKDRRHELQDHRKKLWSVAIQPHLAQHREEERKVAAAGFAEHLGLVGPAPVKDPLGLKMVGRSPSFADRRKSNNVQNESRASRMRLAEETGVPETMVEQLFDEFQKLQRSNNVIGRRGFGKLLEVLTPWRHWAEQDLDAWWAQIVGAQHDEEAPPSELWSGRLGNVQEEEEQQQQPSTGVQRLSSAAASEEFDGEASVDPQLSLPAVVLKQTSEAGRPGQALQLQAGAARDGPQAPALTDKEVASGLAARFRATRDLSKSASSALHQPKAPARAAADFEEFVRWYASSEARAM